MLPNGYLVVVGVMLSTIAQSQDGSHALSLKPGSRETTSITVEANGKGTVTPTTGQHSFPKYNAHGSHVTDSGRDYNTVKFSAKPDHGWVFLYWSGDVVDEPSHPSEPGFDPDAVTCGQYYHSKMKVLMDRPRKIRAEFAYRPEMKDMDLVTDLGHFLVSINEAKKPRDVWNLAFDRGRYKIDDEHGYTGNGVPDAAEFGLLEKILRFNGLSYGPTQGVIQKVVWRDYQKNLPLAREGLNGIRVPQGIDPDAVKRSVAAYMTLGTHYLREMVCSEIREHFGCDLDKVDFARSSDRWLAMDEDADVDGNTNAEEWAAVESRHQGKNRALVNAFTIAALNGKESPLQRNGNRDCERPEDEFLPRVAVTVAADSGVTAYAIILPPAHSNCAEQVIATGETKMVPVCRTIKVHAEGTAMYPFDHWAIPGEMCNESASPNDRFELTGGASKGLSISDPKSVGDLTIRAVAMQRGKVRILRNDSVYKLAPPEGVGKYAAGVVFREEGDYLVVEGPARACARLFYTVVDGGACASGWGVVEDASGTYRQTFANPVKVPLGTNQPDLAPSTECTDEPRQTYNFNVTDGMGIIFAGMNAGIANEKKAYFQGSPIGLRSQTWHACVVVYPGFQYMGLDGDR